MRELLEPYLDQSWTLHHWPEYQPIEVYKQAEYEYIEQLKQVPGLHSIWRFGAVGVPGVSDLDYVVVLDDASGRVPHCKISPQSLSAKSHYIIFHEPYVMNPSLLMAWNRWGNGAELTHLHGETSEPDVLGSKEDRLISAVTLVDFLLHLEPRLFLETLLTGNMHVRGTLCQINASRHLNRLYKQGMQLQSTSWDGFFDEFEAFRRNWFALDESRVSELKGFLIQILSLLFELIRNVQVGFIDRRLFIAENQNNLTYVAPKYLTIWDATKGSNHRLLETVKIWDNLGQIAIILPQALALPVIAMAESSGVVSEYVKINLHGEMYPLSLWNDEIVAAAQEQSRFRNEHVAFLRRKGLFQLNASYFGLGLWPKYQSANPFQRYPRRISYYLRRRRLITSVNRYLSTLSVNLK